MIPAAVATLSLLAFYALAVFMILKPHKCVFLLRWSTRRDQPPTRSELAFIRNYAIAVAVIATFALAAVIPRLF